MILVEGGNVFADVTAFDHKEVPTILGAINNALAGTGINAIPVGSTATPKHGHQSGDMDVMVDEQAVLDYFKVSDAKIARKALNDYMAKKGFQTAQTGISVHVRVPVGQEAHQVDIMVTAKAETISKIHTHDIPPNSPYKGVNKQLLISILARSKGYMWSAFQGLFTRDAAGKKADFVSDDLDQIAKTLLTPSAGAKNLGSVEAILAALPKQQADDLLAKAKQDPNWHELKRAEESIQIGTREWYREWLDRL
jgi:hypothetical protein